MALVMFALSAAVYDIFEVEMFMTFILTFRMGQGKCKYTNRKTTGDLPCIDNSNFCPIFTVYKIVTVEICMILTLTFRMDQGQV